MRDLKQALADIAAIKSQLAGSTLFLGYGPATFAVTGVIAMIFAWLQAVVMPDPAVNVTGYIALWAVAAGISAIIITVEVVTRSRRIHSGLANEMIASAAEQLLPSLVVGALVTFVLMRFAPQNLWMLPGLWQILLSLGVFASCRLLPPFFLAIGAWYLFTGLCCLAFASEAQAFSALAMGVPFGLGQLLAAGLIFFLSGRYGKG